MTGGAGFIGRYCIEAFLEKNYEVTIFDNFSNSSENMISSLLNNGANLVKGDITVQDQVSNAISGHDTVIHLASKISVENSIKFPKETFLTNVDGTINVLNACVKHEIKNVIAASTAAVYGEPENPNIPISEDQKTSPTSPYAESKLKMEQHIKSFSDKYNFNSIILRIFNAYGKGQSPEYAGVITKFLEKISKNESLEIFGDGLQTRDFVSVKDIVYSIHLVISNIDGKRGSIYNIANGKSITIKDLAELMISLSGKSLQVNYLEKKSGEVRFSQANITKAKNDLGFLPKTNLSEGINDLIKVYL